MEVFKPKVFGLRDLPKATSNLRKVDLGISVYRTILALFDAMFLFFPIVAIWLGRICSQLNYHFTTYNNSQ